jgi:hypothetical protein
VRIWLLAAVALMLFAGLEPHAKAQLVSIQIRVLNGKNGKPIKDEKLNVWRTADQRDSEIMPTDTNGVIPLEVDKNSSIRVGGNIYFTCHPYKAGDKERLYSVEKILNEGIVDLNTCGNANVLAKPREFVIYERPRSLWEWMKL